MSLPILRSTKTIPSRWRKYYPLLTLLALALATLSCINTDLKIKVSQTEGAADTLKIDIKQSLSDSFIAAAKIVNQERKADFAAAGRKTDMEDLLPTSRSDIEDMFNIEDYQNQGFTVTTTDTGFSATKQGPLEKDEVTEGWTIKVIEDPNHPGQITYRVKVKLDLSNMEGDDLFELRYQPQMEKPNLAPGSSYTPSGGFLGGLMDGLGAAAGDAQQELAIELYYVQKALKASEPIEYRISVELPGTVVLHKLDGNTAGTLNGNLVTLVLDEKTIGENGGKKLVFHVESIVKDCSKACDQNNHLIWDGEEEGVSCNCVCEAGWEKITGENACVHCDSVCSWSDPNLVREPDKCACTCAIGTTLNRAGTKCITEAEAQAEAEQRPESGGPSPMELGNVFLALLDPDDDRDINQMPGWFLLTSGEREQLLQYIEGLGFAVDRTQLIIDLGPDMTTDQRIQQIKEEQNRLTKIRELAINQLQDEIDERRRIQNVIIKEIGGNANLGQYLTKIPEWYSKLHQSSYDLAKNYVEGKLTGAVKKRVLQETHGKSPASYPAAAAELIKQIPQMATNSCVDDFNLYMDLFKANCKGNCQGDNASLAHEMALDELQKKVGPNRVLWSEPGNAYDNAFRKLNPDVP